VFLTRAVRACVKQSEIKKFALKIKKLCAQLVRHYYDIESFNMFPVFRAHLNICFCENAIG